MCVSVSVSASASASLSLSLSLSFCVHVCVCTHTHKHTNTHKHTHTHTHTHTHISGDTGVLFGIGPRTQAASSRGCVSLSLSLSLCVCVCRCIYISRYACHGPRKGSDIHIIMMLIFLQVCVPWTQKKKCEPRHKFSKSTRGGLTYGFTGFTGFTGYTRALTSENFFSPRLSSASRAQWPVRILKSTLYTVTFYLQSSLYTVTFYVQSFLCTVTFYHECNMARTFEKRKRRQWPVLCLKECYCSCYYYLQRHLSPS